MQEIWHLVKKFRCRLIGMPIANTIYQKPYMLLLVMGLIVFFLSFGVANDSVDIHFHDTYIVITYRPIIWAFAIFLMALGIVYRICHVILFSAYLSWIHIVTTILVLGFIISFIFTLNTYSGGMPRRYLDITASVPTKYSWSLFILLIAQLLLLLNILLGLLKKKKAIK
jgi:hypothetical protein